MDNLLNYLYYTPVASAIFVITIGLSLFVFSNENYFVKLMLHPYGIHRDKSKLYTVITSGLIHRDGMHLLFNMFTFYYFGFALESMFVQFSGSVGHLLFAGFYIVTLILSDVPTIIRHKNNPGYYSLGASGAICAVLFSFILFQPKQMLGLFMIIPIPAYLFGFLFLGYCIWAAKQARDSINHDAHLFGAIAGLLFTILLYPWSFRNFLEQF